MRKKVLLVCYGGGHVQSLLPVAQRLLRDGNVDLQVLGLTTAYSVFRTEGIPVMGASELLESGDEEYIELAKVIKPAQRHASISEADDLAYYALGLRDLVGVRGKAEAIELFVSLGRKSFLPVNVFKRFLYKLNPDLVVTTSSPRSELAAQYAASDLGITGLSITDLFVENESVYVCDPRYARNITVFSNYVKLSLIDKGCNPNNIFVTGNPAFDGLARDTIKADAQIIRRKLGFADDEIIVCWACPSGKVSMRGKTFVDPSEMLRALQDYCLQKEKMSLLVRQHPNAKIISETDLVCGVICPEDIDVNTVCNFADIFVVETSTIGLQAALLGKPVVTVDSWDYPPYAKLGLANNIESLDELAEAIECANKPNLQQLGCPPLGTATESVVTLIHSILD